MRRFNARDLGRVQHIDPRSIWRDEASEFTPWLAERENLSLLGEAVGLRLKAKAIEQRVGRFHADILCDSCHDRGQTSLVLIENQLSKSDHGHLGQLLTYATGLKTRTVIWVAPDFCEEHLAALKSLNEATNGLLNFFALRMEIWRIAGGLPGVRFVVAAGPCRPKLERPIRSGVSKRPDSAQKRLHYWQTFISNLQLEASDLKTPQPNTLGNLWFNLRGRSLWITVYAASSLGRIGVFLRGQPSYYNKLLQMRQDIEGRLGERPRWHKEGDYWSVGISKEANPLDESDWPRQHSWLSKSLKKFIWVFKSYVEIL